MSSVLFLYSFFVSSCVSFQCVHMNGELLTILKLACTKYLSKAKVISDLDFFFFFWLWNARNRMRHSYMKSIWREEKTIFYKQINGITIYEQKKRYLNRKPNARTPKTFTFNSITVLPMKMKRLHGLASNNINKIGFEKSTFAVSLFGDDRFSLLIFINLISIFRCVVCFSVRFSFVSLDSICSRNYLQPIRFLRLHLII